MTVGFSPPFSTVIVFWRHWVWMFWACVLVMKLRPISSIKDMMRVLFIRIKLFPRDNLLDIIELVEGFEGGEVVNVEAEDLITNLT